MTPAEIKALADEWAERIAYDKAHYPPVDPLFVKTEAALRSFMDGGWRPIETDPRDGRLALVFRPLARLTSDEPVAVKRLIGGNNHCWPRTVPEGHEPNNPTNGACHVTHWMPLPTPPAVEGEAGADPR